MQCCSSNEALQEDRAIDRRHIRRLAQIAEKYKQKAKGKDTTKVLKTEVCVKAEAAVVAVGGNIGCRSGLSLSCRSWAAG